MDVSSLKTDVTAEAISVEQVLELLRQQIEKNRQQFQINRRLTARVKMFETRLAENFADMQNLQATILHLLAIDHTRPTFYNNGIQRR